MKSRLQFICQQCGCVTSKWYGKCPECHNWNSLIEELVAQPTKAIPRGTNRNSPNVVPLKDVTDDLIPRIPLPLDELHRLVGQGLTRGSVVLLAGDPGIGKSTLLLQLLGNLGRTHERPLLYISGEESVRQIKLRADRLSIAQDRVYILAETNVAEILSHMETLAPEIAVVDSVQTLYWPELESIPGSISQVREVSDRLVRLAKQRDMAIFLIGHVTKEGNIAGPMTLEHLVDTVLFFEGDRGQPYRILRTQKNRFGPTEEIAVFEMREEGLREVSNPSALFLKDRPENAPGSVTFPAVEGSRPLLVEIQGLATKSSYGLPMRTSVGFDKNRLTMLLAVLEKRAGVQFSSQDVYVNVVGGLRISEPAVDLAVAAAVVSSLVGKVFPSNAVVFGEIGLTGEIRAVSRAEMRLKEAQKLGFTSAVLPAIRQPSPNGLQPFPLQNVKELVGFFR